MSEWQWRTIESAPKESFQHVLLWTPDDRCVYIGYWDDGMESGGWQQAFGGPDDVLQPTHWAPTPAPPEGA